RKGMEEAVLAAVLKETPALERFLAMLAVLAGVAPLLGLLGTVMGMIATFDVIRVFGSGEPGLMAGGISEALVATATGLVIAIPILVFHSVFAGRADRILADVQRHGSSLVDIACAAEDNGFASEALAPISSRAPLSVPGGAGAPRQ
ncbi:MAG: MotA/TolQ/ExbB proton channel family protein, partial [Planctomycetes bacterium]|nr:MotA/TolQ/ExbB proton channel family protein [Planctomycetota bacterium]